LCHDCQHVVSDNRTVKDTSKKTLNFYIERANSGAFGQFQINQALA